MKRVGMPVVMALACTVGVAGQSQWPQWRGPGLNGVVPGDAPTTWNDASRVSWKVGIPGRGFSSPVVSGDRLFLTTAVPTGNVAPAAEAAGGRGAGGNAGVEEHRFVVMAIDRVSGKTLWERTAATATPHEGYHRIYGSFASNNPATDGRRVYAFFGSQGLYAYDLNGQQIWKRDFNQRMKMRLQFGEGTAVVQPHTPLPHREVGSSGRVSPAAAYKQ